MKIADLWKKAKEYLNPQSNGGNNFWSSPVAQGMANTQRKIQPAVSNVQAWANPQVRQNFNQQVIQPKVQQITGPQTKGPLPTIPPIISQKTLKSPLLDKFANFSAQGTRAVVNTVPNLINSFSNANIYNPETKKIFPQSRLRPENQLSKEQLVFWKAGLLANTPETKKIMASAEWKKLNDYMMEPAKNMIMQTSLNGGSKGSKPNEKLINENFDRMFGKGGSTVAVRNGPNVAPPVAPIKIGPNVPSTPKVSTPEVKGVIPEGKGITNIEADLKSKYPQGGFKDAKTSLLTTDGKIVSMPSEVSHNNAFGKDQMVLNKYLDDGGVRIRYSTGFSGKYPSINIEINKVPTESQLRTLESLPNDVGIVYDIRGGGKATVSSDITTNNKKDFLKKLKNYFPELSQSPTIPTVQSAGSAPARSDFRNSMSEVPLVYNSRDTELPLASANSAKTATIIIPYSPSIPSVNQSIIKIKPNVESPKIKLVQSKPQENIQPPSNLGVSPVTSKPISLLPSKTSFPDKTLKNPTESLVDSIIKSGSKERGFVATIKGSAKTAPEVRQTVSGQYIPRANDSLSRVAKAQIKTNIDVARQKALTGLDDESVAIANELIQHYSNLKDFDTATYIANTTAENLTAHGRAIQAASLYDKLTPEGIQRYAATQLQKVKMQLKPEDAKRLSEIAKQVQAMPAGEGKAMAQQQLMQEIQGLIPSSNFQKLITLWKAGLLTGLKTTGRNITGNTINNVSEIVKDVPATATDMIASLFTGQRTKVFTIKGVGSGLKEGAQKGVTLLKTGFDERKQMGKLDINFVNWGKSKVGQAAKVYTQTVFRFLGAQDQPFYYASLKRSLNDQASAAAINAGKRGDSAYIAKLVANPTEQMIKTSVLDAERAVFQNNTALSSAINSAKRAIKSKTELGGAIADFVAPFTGVPSSIVGQVVNYTPVGLAKTIIENIGKGKFNQRQFSEGIGRGITGTGIMAIGAALFGKGLMTLDYPKDQKEQAQWDLEGKQAFSVLGADNKWHSIGSLGPQASVLLQGGYLASGGGGQAILGGLKQQKEQTFLQGIKNLSDAIDDPTGKAGAYAKSTLGSIIPTIVGDLAKGLDPLQRESNNPLQSMQAKTPFLRQGLLPSRNVFGEAKPNEQGFVGSMVDFTNSTKAKTAPPIGELRRLSDETYPATPIKISTNQTIQKMKVKLTPEQLNAFEAKAGPIIKERINQLIQTPGYQKLSDEKKAKAIQDITTTVRTQIKNSMDLKSLSAGTFETSADAPKNALETIKVYGEGLFKDPKAVITAVSQGQPIRKIRGDAVVLERAQSLGAIDKGDKTTQVDHVIPLSLGGSNNQSNLQVISNQENQAKAVVEVYLGDLLSKGTINKKEAQDRILNWRAEIAKMPSTYQNKANAILSKPATISIQKVDENKLQNIGQTYQIVDDKGNVSDINLTMPERPTLTGQTELDKLIKSKFSGQLTTLKNNIVKLNLDGQLSAEEANAAIIAINNLKLKSGGSGSKKLKKAPAIAKVSVRKVSYKIAKSSKKKLTGVKIAKMPNLKALASTKISKLKYDVGKVKNIKIAKVKGLTVGKKLA